MFAYVNCLLRNISRFVFLLDILSASGILCGSGSSLLYVFNKARVHLDSLVLLPPWPTSPLQTLQLGLNNDLSAQQSPTARSSKALFSRLAHTLLYPINTTIHTEQCVCVCVHHVYECMCVSPCRVNGNMCVYSCWEWAALKPKVPVGFIGLVCLFCQKIHQLKTWTVLSFGLKQSSCWWNREVQGVITVTTKACWNTGSSPTIFWVSNTS